ncbi:MAG: hypothetical protein HFH32_07795 [Eubacterium sp.]|jgi:hypothetical protein|nr:hypothetical protein [Eubacterium sp.]
MSQENKEKKFKDNGLMMKIAVTSLLTALLMMIEIYEIINDSANLIAIGSLGVFILVSVFSTALLIGRLNELKAKQQEEAFDNVLRSEKASYLLMRKYFDKMEQKMDSINENAGLPYKELVSAQKALAKAQINRNKQNTNALLMSNDRIMQKLSSFQKELANQKNTAGQDVTFNPGELANVTAGLSEQDKAELKESLSERVAESSKDILASQKEILSGIKEMEKSLRSEIAESASRAVSMKSQLKPLDMEDEESLPQIQTESRQEFENSSESDLDNLLMQMGEAGAEEPVLGDIMGEPELSPIMDESGFALDSEPSLDSMLGEPELAPMLDEPGLPSIAGEPELQPIADESGLPSMTGEPELAPMLDEPGLPSMLDEPELASIADEPGLSSMTNEPELASVMGEPLLPPIMGESEALPSIDESGLEPIAGGPELQPGIEEPGLPPIDGEPELSPILEEPAVSPMTGGPELSPMLDEPELPSMSGESELQSMLDEFEVSPVMEESPSMPDEAAISPMADEPVSAQEESGIAPMTGEQELQSMLDEIEVSPMAGGPELAPIMDEPELSSMPGESELASAQENASAVAVGEEAGMPEADSLTMPAMDDSMQPVEEAAPVTAQEPVSAAVATEEEPSLDSIMEEAPLPFIDPAAVAAEGEADALKVYSDDDIVDTLDIGDLEPKNPAKTESDLDAMISKMGVTPKAEKTPSKPVSPLSLAFQPPRPAPKKKAGDEIEQIMKDMDIKDIMEEQVEDLDIDKILEMPMPGSKKDSSDTSQVMSSDEIAALIAKTELLSAPEPKKDEMPDLSDPSYVMSSDEIAALIANM